MHALGLEEWCTTSPQLLNLVAAHIYSIPVIAFPTFISNCLE